MVVFGTRIACRICSGTKFLDVFEYPNSSSEGIYLIVGERQESEKLEMVGWELGSV